MLKMWLGSDLVDTYDHWKHPKKYSKIAKIVYFLLVC